MSRFLSQSNIELLENFIASNEPNSSDFLPAISEHYREDAIKDWETINDPETPVTSYLQFASASLGMTSYGFYKTRDGRIFLINAFCSQITAYYYVTTNWSILIPHDQYVKKQSDALLYSNDEDLETCSSS
jgi:hypothetical protein